MPTNVYGYWRYCWGRLSTTQKRKRVGGLLMVGVLWLVGSWWAFGNVLGISYLHSLWLRRAAAMLMAPHTPFWALLVADYTLNPGSGLWRWLCLLTAAAAGMALFLLFKPATAGRQQQWQQSLHHHEQGHLSAHEAVAHLEIKVGVPLARVGRRLIGVDYATGEGHVLVTAPTGGGKGLHLTQTLAMWPGPLVVVDPKGEQYARMAEARAARGPVYQLPEHRLNLAPYFGHLLYEDHVAELHRHLMQPWKQGNRIFADKARTLFSLAGLYAKAYDLNPLRVLLDAALSDPLKVLSAFELVSPDLTRLFLDGEKPAKMTNNRFATSAYGTFTTQMRNYVANIDTIAPEEDARLIPLDWAEQKATIFITYRMEELAAVGGVVSAIMAALMRYQVMTDSRERVLVAVDELPAVGLENTADYLATVRGYGITMLLYAQSFAQLKSLYGHNGAQAILDNCRHQVWYPPTNAETAELMSKLYGTELAVQETHSQSRQLSGEKRLGASVSQSLRMRAALNATKVLGMMDGQVMVQTARGQQVRFVAQRLAPLKLLKAQRERPLRQAQGKRFVPPPGNPQVSTPWHTAEKRQRELKREVA